MPFQNLSIAEAEAQIAAFAAQQPRRIVRSIDTHHTYRPHKGQWRGEPTVNAMEAFHRSLGWSAIGQHWTIGPDGSIWTGRDLNQIPCSQTGFNTGALMYEIVGNFCTPNEPGTEPPYDILDGAQLEAAIAVSASVVAQFQLRISGIRFHRQLHAPGQPSPKTCPGRSIDYEWFVDLVDERCFMRWQYNAPGRIEPNLVAAFDPGDTEASAHDVQVASDFDPAQYETGLA